MATAFAWPPSVFGVAIHSSDDQSTPSPIHLWEKVLDSQITRPSDLTRVLHRSCLTNRLNSNTIYHMYPQYFDIKVAGNYRELTPLSRIGINATNNKVCMQLIQNYISRRGIWGAKLGSKRSQGLESCGWKLRHTVKSEVCHMTALLQ